MIARWTCIIFCLFFAAPAPATGESRLCDDAARRAAEEFGVPLSVMLGVTRVETGRSEAGRITPWPWTLNLGGPGSWHPTAQAALATAQDALASGRRNIDIGCFQINYHWHGAEFADLAQMLDPLANARHAARFLRDLHAEFGDWTVAVGAFHSRNPAHATRYLDRFRVIHAGLDDLPDRPPGLVGPAPLSMIARPALFPAEGRSGLVGGAPMTGGMVRPLWGAP